LKLWEDETGLHLYQKPKHANLLIIYSVGTLLVLLLFLLAFVPMEILGQSLFYAEVWQEAVGGLVVIAITVILTIRTFHVHRFIDFGGEMVRFRTRWLFWERSRSIFRCELGNFCGNLWTVLLGGVVLSYGRNRSFYILATQAEREYLVSTVHRWCWRTTIARSDSKGITAPPCYRNGLLLSV
jgi:hypothetical protein